MQKTVKRIICISLLLIMILGGFCACGKVKYKADLYYNINEHFAEGFFDQNRTYGAYYYVDIYDSEEGEWKRELKYEENAPKTRDFIIENEEDFSEVFKSFPVEIDFNNEILIVHLYSSYNRRARKLKNIDLKDGHLTVVYKVKAPPLGVCDASMPGPGSIAVKMKKVPINSVEFIEK